MNYILHLSAFYTKVYSDARLSPFHISLYSAIFQLWNAAHFENPFQVSRQELMKLSKIGSVNTYIRTLKQLHTWGYIEYSPSKNISIGSRIRVITFDNTTDKTSDIPVRHINKHIKTYLNIPTISEVEDFFKNENFTPDQAPKFFNHYQANGWMMGANQVMNWQAAAISWISKTQKFENSKTPAVSPKQTSAKPNNLSVKLNKKYDEPL